MNYKKGKVKNIHYGDIHTKFPPLLDCKNNMQIPFINPDIDLSKFDDENYLKNGDLIIADASEDYNDIGKAIEVQNIDDEKILAGLHTILARDEKDITVDGFKTFLFLSNTLKHEIKVIANGASVLGISKENLSKLTVKIPSIKEQQKIIDFLILIQEKLNLLEKKYDLLIQFKEYVMYQLFTRKIKLINSDNKWGLKKIKEIGKINTGNTPSTKIKDFYYPEKYLWVTPSDIRDSKYIIDTERKLSYEGAKKGRLVKKNSVLVTCIASIGKNCIIPVDGYFNQQINSITPNENFNTDFIYYLISYNSKKMKNYAGITATPILNKKSFESMVFEFPNLKDQKYIANFISKIDEKIDLIKSNINKTKEFKKYLLQKMFV